MYMHCYAPLCVGVSQEKQQWNKLIFLVYNVTKCEYKLKGVSICCKAVDYKLCEPFTFAVVGVCGSHLVEHGSQLGLVLCWGSLSLQPQEKLWFPVRFEGQQVDDAFPQGLRGGGRHAAAPPVGGRLLEEATFRSRQGSGSLLVFDAFIWEWAEIAGRNLVNLRPFRFRHIGFLENCCFHCF